MSSSVIQVAKHKSFMILDTSTVHTILRSYEVHVASFISVSLHMGMNSVRSHWEKIFKKSCFQPLNINKGKNSLTY